MKDMQPKFNDSQTSSQNSSSFSVEFVQGSNKLLTMPSFSKLQGSSSQLSNNRINIKKNNIKSQLQGLFTSETVPQKKIERIADRSHLGFVVTPEKGDMQAASYLPSSSIIYSPREVRSNNSPKMSNFAERQLYEKRIRQMTKDWGDERSNLKKQIRQLEFIVQQWQMMDQRKNGSIVKQNLQSAKSLTAFNDTTSIAEAPQKQSTEILKLRQQLEEVEQERNQMFQDFVDLEQQLKKIRPAVFDHSAISSLRFGETSRSDFEREVEVRVNEEVEMVRQSYEKIIGQKEERYQELLQDFTEVQEQLERQRSETMILLQKRTTQLESNLSNLRIANDEINSELRCVIDRLGGELAQEKEKASTLQIELSRRQQNCRLLENELSLVNKDLQELREVYMDKCIQFEVGKPSLNRRDMDTQTTKSSGKTIEVQVEMKDTGQQMQLQALRDERRLLQYRMSNLQSSLQERQARLNSSQNNVQEYLQTIRRLQASINQLSQENARLKGSVVETSIVNQELRSSRMSERSQNSDWKLEKAVLKKQLLDAKEQLENSRKKLDKFRNQHHYEKIQVSSQDRLTRNKYEVQIHNLTSELDAAKIKMQSMQSRLEMRKRELKEKDDFIQSTIVARVGKNLNQTETDYFIRKLEEFTEVCRKVRE